MGGGKLIQRLLAIQIAFPEGQLVQIRFSSELAATGHALEQLDTVTGAVAHRDRRTAMWAFFCSYRSVLTPFQMATKIVVIGIQSNPYPAK